MKSIGFIKKLVFLLVGLMVPLVSYAQFFGDVPSYHQYADAIEDLAYQGVISGYPDGTFKPDQTINRAEFVKIIVESQFSDLDIETCLADHTMPTWAYVYFDDVPYQSWFSKYICVAATHGIVAGYPDGTFHPSQPINFAEALKILLESAQVDVRTVRFAEHPLLYVKSSDWFSRYFIYAHNKALINPQKFYHPGQLVTRGEMADLIYRFNENARGGSPAFPEQTHSTEYTLTIPKLNIINLNVSFADPYNAKKALEVLKYGLGHYLSPPGGGQKMVIFGHSSGYNWDTSSYKQVLRQINKLEAGDRIYINYHERGFVYEVVNKEILPAQNLAAIMNDYGYEELALYTCWPPDSIKQRYVVHALPVST